MTTSTPESSNIPESINPEQLQELLESAPTKNSAASGPYDGLDREELIQLVKRTLDAFDERCGHPMGQKLMALTILANGIGWHTAAGRDSFDDDNRSGVAWLRDAGKLQSASTLLADVSFGEDDFTNRQN